MERVLIDIVNRGSPGTNLGCSMDKMAKSTHFVHALAQGVVGITSITTSIAAFVKNHGDRMVEEVRFQKSLEIQLSQTRYDANFLNPYELIVT